MGANNVKTLKLFGVSKRKPSFRFHNQETVTVILPISWSALGISFWSMKCSWSLRFWATCCY
jgi:hypothetical protein